MVRILLIGNGAREHVIAETLKRSRYDVEIFAVGKTKNPGLSALAEDYLLADVVDKNAIADFAKRVNPSFAILGPEAPIAAGIADMLLEMEIHSVAPLQTVGRLESSKSFTRDLLEKYGIEGNPKFKVFYEESGMEEFFNELGEDYVVKADGLKGGKGVMVSGDHLNGIAEGLAYARECLADGGRVVVEEKLVGQEFSLMSFCDGKHTVEMPAVQDHKRAYEGDKGPNTGGMGTYSCADHSMPFLRENDLAIASDITAKVAKALFEETGCYFKGVMYGGFMAVKNGVRLIEYNARFGDPEAMNVLPLLKTDFVDVCQAIINGDLDNLNLEFEKKATVCKYVVPKGYPDNAVKGARIDLSELLELVRVIEDQTEQLCKNNEVEKAKMGQLKFYYASVDQREDGLYLAGSRAIAVVGISPGLEPAEGIAQAGAESVKGPVFYRKDIGTQALIDAKVEMMRQIRA